MARGRGLAPELADRPVELADHPVGEASEGVDQRGVVPERPVPLPAEAFEHRLAALAHVGQDRSRVVELVGERDAQGGFVLAASDAFADVGDILLLAFAPRGLGVLVGVGARVHDVRDHVAELLPDVIEPRAASLILGRVVQERADHFFLALGAVLQDERCDAEQVRQVGDAGALARLVRVDPVRVPDRVIEPLGQAEPRSFGHGRTLPDSGEGGERVRDRGLGRDGDHAPSILPSSSTRKEDRISPT